MSNFHSGSKILLPFSEAVGLKIDQFNFLFCQISACGIGYLFSRYLSRAKINPNYKHISEIILGILLTLFCFGLQIWYLLAQSISVYVMMNVLSVRKARYCILIFVLFFLSVAHIGRMYYDYGSYTLDITGPLMIQTQKLSSLAFNLMDGQRVKNKEKLRKDYHQVHAINHYPTVLEFFSYTFYFHGLMVGPFVFLGDYLRFIEGRQDELFINEDDKNHFKRNKFQILSAWPEISFHLFSLVCYSLLFFFIEPYFKPEFLLSDEFYQNGFFKRYLLMTITMFLVRQKYYIAWTMGSITNLFAGLGFSGFDEKQQPKYHIVKNFHFSRTEFGTSAKTMIDHWNVGTAIWLRECVYDRVPQSIGTITVFTCSAIWHGYYPGYYLAFASVALMTNAARCGRRLFRTYFHNAGLKLPYDITTATMSMFCLNFSIIPFALLDIRKGFMVWKSLYFLGPVGCTILLFIGNVMNLKLRNNSKFE